MPLDIQELLGLIQGVSQRAREDPPREQPHPPGPKSLFGATVELHASIIQALWRYQQQSGGPGHAQPAIQRREVSAPAGQSAGFAFEVYNHAQVPVTAPIRFEAVSGVSVRIHQEPETIPPLGKQIVTVTLGLDSVNAGETYGLVLVVGAARELIVQVTIKPT